MNNEKIKQIEKKNKSIQEKGKLNKILKITK